MRYSTLRKERKILVKCVDTPFSTFCRILEALPVKWPNLTPRFASTPERRNGTINLNKYFISLSGDRTHIMSILQSHFVPLRHDWPHLIRLLQLIHVVSMSVGRFLQIAATQS